MYAVLSDAHSNLEALQSVLKDIKRKGVREVLFLGDAVGYGPDPDRCVKLLHEECEILIAGNHDWCVCGLTDIDSFNENARAAIMWTKTVMRPENINALATAPVRVDLGDRGITLVHSTPLEPEKWHYLLYLADAESNFQYFDTAVCLIGHSHIPVIIERRLSGGLSTNKNGVDMRPGHRYIINVGSVGQPRDGDPRACYTLVDEERVEIVKVPYSVEITQRKMTRAGLPSFLVERLAVGM